MYFNTQTVPDQHGLLQGPSPYSLYDCKIPIHLPQDLARLHQEKEFLSKGLADCVTYLKVLCEKQTGIARQLGVDVVLPNKKRKRLQHTKCCIDNEIKNRLRDERALLNNLQACETNIFLTNAKAYHLSNASFHVANPAPTPTLYGSTLCSYSGSEITDVSWEGWTDEAAVSPFQKQSSNPFFVEDLAPDACTEDPRHDSAVSNNIMEMLPISSSRKSVEPTESTSVSTDTILSQSTQSTLDPEAAPFQPTYVAMVDANLVQSFMASIAIDAIENMKQRRFSATEIVPILQGLSIRSSISRDHLPGQMWCKLTPQTNPQSFAGMPVGKQRTNSL